MGSILEFKARQTSKESDDFLEVMDAIKYLYSKGELKDILVIIESKSDGKFCTSNGMFVDDAVDMCKDFVRNTEEYLD